MKQHKKYKNIDEYISLFSGEMKERLETIRKVIREEAPEATETISYMMPTFKLNGNLVHFAAFRNHIGFYPTPTGTEAFKKELQFYKTSKGSAQFPYNEPLPISLIREIVRYRVKENLAKVKK